jgi:hypothetical protein
LEHPFKIGDRVAVARTSESYDEGERGTVVGFFFACVRVRLDRPRTALVEGREHTPPTIFQPDEIVMLAA